MKPPTQIVVIALLLASPRAMAQTAPKPAPPSQLEENLAACDQMLDAIAVTKKAIDGSGSAGVSPADDVRARRWISAARRMVVETSTGTDLPPSSPALKEILVYVPKLLDALTQQSPAGAPETLLADGTTRVATVVDSAGLEAATHALNIVIDSLELAAAARHRSGSEHGSDLGSGEGEIGWKTADAGKEAAELIKGATDCMLLIGRNATTLQQVIQSGLVILGETHSFEANLIRTFTSSTAKLNGDDHDRAVTELQSMEEADERIETLHQSVQKELAEPAPAQTRTASNSPAATSAADQPAPSEVEPPPSATPDEQGNADPADANADRNEATAADSTVPDDATANDQPRRTDDSSATDEVPAAQGAPSNQDDQSEADRAPDEGATPSDRSRDAHDGDEASAPQPDTNEHTDADTPPDDQVEASPADVEADQQQVRDQNDGDESAADPSSDSYSTPPDVVSEQPDTDRSDEPAVEPGNPPPPPDADAQPDEQQPAQPPSPPPAPPPH